MVFTTLSSTGRRIFSRLENAFENVLVDEAAQASEIAVLQPLILGCTRYPLVLVTIDCQNGLCLVNSADSTCCCQ